MLVSPRHLKTCFAGITTVMVLALGACSSGGSGRFALMEGLIFGTSPTDYPRTQAEIDAYPYAQLGVVYDEGRPGIAVLAEYVDGHHLWVASDRFVLLSTPSGRVLSLQVNGASWKTADLANDPLASNKSKAAGQQFSYSRPLEVGNSDRSTPQVSELQCLLTAGATEVIRQVERELTVRRWDERCKADSGESATWTVWVDAKGRMRRAAGTVAPGAKPMLLDVLKVPA